MSLSLSIYIYIHMFIYIYLLEARQRDETRRWNLRGDCHYIRSVTYIYIYIHIYIYIYIYTYSERDTYTHTYLHITQREANARYGQFSKFHVCFCGLDPGNLKFETVRTNKQRICF